MIRHIINHLVYKLKSNEMPFFISNPLSALGPDISARVPVGSGLISGPRADEGSVLYQPTWAILVKLGELNVIPLIILNKTQKFYYKVKF
jgi:hypothetical protein